MRIPKSAGKDSKQSNLVELDREHDLKVSEFILGLLGYGGMDALEIINAILDEIPTNDEHMAVN